MFSYIYMKILEAYPNKYDSGISLLSFGQVDTIKKEMVKRFINSGDRVLDIGTGTGSLAFLAAEQGANVLGIDASQKMLAFAESKRKDLPEKKSVSFEQIPICDLDLMPVEKPFDVVTASLVFSELDDDERRYTVKHAARLLKPGGLFLINDEKTPAKLMNRFFYRFIRSVMSIFTVLFTGRTTYPVDGLGQVLRKNGYEIEFCEIRSMDSAFLLCARKS